MKPTLNEKFLAYLALFSGLFLSLVAEYYSILGLTSIFSAAVIPVIIMGIALGLGKVTATLWLKQNWKITPWTMRGYLFTAILVLMIVTSMGIFGFLSKAHSDQNLVSGDVLAKISVYDEKIKTSQDNIDVNRKALKQLDEAVDQVMGRSTSETGADKAVAVRKSQTKERTRLLAEITTEQKTISGLREQRAPIAAEVRKVEAEVGPIKYIAAFVYGETDQTILEKAVTWVIVILIVVFDPLAVILLLSSQISFQNFREREDPNEKELKEFADAFNEVFAEGDSPKGPVDIVEEKPTVTEPIHCHKCNTELVNAPGIGLFCPNKECDVLDGPFADDEPKEKSIFESHPYLLKPFDHFKDTTPIVYTPEVAPVVETAPTPIVATEESKVIKTKVFPRPSIIIPTPDMATDEYVQNEEQTESNLWSSTVESAISATDYKRIAKENRDREIENYAMMVRSRQMSMSDVPEEFQPIVKSKV